MTAVAGSLVQMVSLKGKALDIIVWGLIFLICLNGNSYIFRTAFFALPTLVYSVILFLLVVSNQLLVVNYGSYKVKQGKWLTLACIVVAAYIMSVLVSILPLFYLADVFPENERLASTRNVFTVENLFSYRSFIYVFSIVVTPNLIAAAFFSSKETMKPTNGTQCCKKKKRIWS